MERGPKDRPKKCIPVQSNCSKLPKFDVEFWNREEFGFKKKNTTYGGFQPLFRSFMNFSKSNSASSSKASRSSQSQSSITWWKYSGLLRGHMHGKCCYHCWRKRYSTQTIPPVPKKPRITGFSLFTAMIKKASRFSFSQHSHNPPIHQASTNLRKLSHVSTSPTKWLSPFLWRWWFHSHQRRNPERLLGLGLSVLQCGGPW